MPNSKSSSNSESKEAAPKPSHLRFALLPAQDLWSSPSATIEISLPDELVPAVLGHPSIMVTLPIAPWANVSEARLQALETAKQLIDEHALLQWIVRQADSTPPAEG